jgi:CO/xanthine dehydrogenase Mo-binding subunit
MTKLDKPSHFSRRAILKGTGALVVSVGMPVGLDTVLAIRAAQAQGARPPLTPDQLSSYIAVNADGTVSAFFGKMDMGQGLFVAIGQIVAEEVDVSFGAVKVFMGDTATSVNQGGASGSTGIQRGGVQMRMAAAEARRVLVEMAAERLALPPDQLTVTDGVVHAKNDAAKKVSYADLIGGRYFNVQLDWNKRMGNALYAPGKAKPKKPSEHRIVGQRIKREDVAPKVFCQEDFCTDIRVPGMLHGRMIRPAVAGSVPVEVDESSIKDIPGARVAWEKAFLGVVAPKEWDAIKAAQQLKVEWSDVKPPFVDQAELYDHIRSAPVRKRADVKPNGNVDEAFKNAARVIEAEYEWPFQSHACMGPACALVEIKDGKVTCWSGTQKSHFVAEGIAATIGVPVSDVRVIWQVGPALMGAAMPTMRRWMPPCSRRLSALRCACSTRASRAPAGTPRDRRRSTARGRRSMRTVRSWPTSSSARRSPESTSAPTGANRTTRLPDRIAASRSSRATISACRRSLTASPTSAPCGRRSRRCSTVPRRCAPRICAIRSARRFTSRANPSSMRWRQR